MCEHGPEVEQQGRLVRRLVMANTTEIGALLVLVMLEVARGC